MALNKKLVNKNVTIRDVAEEAGVSIALVSFVMNAERGPNGEYLCCASQQTAERIVAVAKRLGYHSNNAAISLRSGCSKTIGLIVSDLSNTSFADICRKIENLSTDAGYLTIIGSSDDKKDKTDRLISKFMHTGVDGLIVAPCPDNEEAVKSLLERDIPVVFLDRDIKNITGVGKVLVDNIKAGEMSARILVDQGYKQVMLVRYKTEIRSLLDREEGFVRYMKKKNLTSYVRVVGKETMRDDMIQVIRDAVEEGVDAVVFPSNSITLAGIAAINRIGYDVPGRLGVVGFDQEDRTDIFNPAIIFINQPTKQVAEYAFKMLIDNIRDGKPLYEIRLEPNISKSC